MSEQSDELNQCDGCKAGMTTSKEGIHRDQYGKAVMVCQKSKYHKKSETHEVKERDCEW